MTTGHPLVMAIISEALEELGRRKRNVGDRHAVIAQIIHQVVTRMPDEQRTDLYLRYSDDPEAATVAVSEQDLVAFLEEHLTDEAERLLSTS